MSDWVSKFRIVEMDRIARENPMPLEPALSELLKLIPMNRRGGKLFKRRFGHSAEKLKRLFVEHSNKPFGEENGWIRLT